MAETRTQARRLTPHLWTIPLPRPIFLSTAPLDVVFIITIHPYNTNRASEARFQARELLGGAGMYVCGNKRALPLSSAELWPWRQGLCLPTSLPAHIAEHAWWSLCSVQSASGNSSTRPFLGILLFVLTSVPLPHPRSCPLSLYVLWTDKPLGQSDFNFDIFPKNCLLFYFCSVGLGEVTPISAHALSFQITTLRLY